VRLAIIAPKAYFPLTKNYSDDYGLFLAHWVRDNNEFAEMVENLNFSIKILDNGAAEGQLIYDVDMLMTLADKIGADEIIIPDVFRNFSRSWANVVRYYDVIRDAGFRPFVVLQGATINELEKFWVNIYESGYKDAVIGLGNEVFLQADRSSKQPRNKFVWYMLSKHPWIVDYDIHYLGYSTIWDWLYAPRFIRGSDSGIFLKAAKLRMLEIPDKHISGYHLEVDEPFNNDVYSRAKYLIEKTKMRIDRGW